MNKQSIQFFKTLSQNLQDPKKIKFSLENKDSIRYDINLIKRFAGSDKTLLDLGSGTGLIVNRIFIYFKKIVAIELFKEFSKFIKKEKTIIVLNQNLLNINIEDKFDVVTMFGTAHYFNEEESFKIYNKVFNLLEKEGIFILKNQFGVHKTKTITYSKELESNYYAQYRELNFEIERLKSIGFKNIEVIDIYPKEYNRWKNTHFYAIVCKKKD